MSTLVAYTFRWGIVPQVIGEFGHGVVITLELSALILVFSLVL